MARMPLPDQGSDRLPDGVIIYGYQDDPAYMYDTAIDHGAAGVVFAGMGAGSVSKRDDAAIRARLCSTSCWSATARG